jgi:deoxyribodipyrimidine photolyase-related protein
MASISLVFPHQLFRELPRERRVLLVEEYLFLRQYPFHKQKLIFHRASMKAYEKYLVGKGFEVEYIDSANPLSDVRQLLPELKRRGITQIRCYDVCDNWLEKRLRNGDIPIHFTDSPLFLLSKKEVDDYFNNKKRYFQTDFYTAQRKKRNILLQNGQPAGGKWTFDAENRLKYPKGKTPPRLERLTENEYYQEAKRYVAKHFPDNYGDLESTVVYPTTFEEAEAWLDDFLANRFRDFGPYEDAILKQESILHHSVLTPMLNTGLLTPGQILDRALDQAARHDIPLQSLEGFVRQILGWREFIRAMYEREGTRQRTANFWGFKRKIPPSFYDGTTGIAPVDQTIRKLLKTGYTHHIERLMVLGNFMLLCEFDPDEVYRWFLELFIDAYDWVMVPNVYGMSQFADGGLMCTKPYISGSNYLFKMSDYEKGAPWAAVWDALFWRFLHVHRDFFTQNPRLGMLVKSFDNMETGKKTRLLTTADQFLQSLDKSILL